jgi:CubicO group peptidase (beta-lactamase class C family)
MSAARIKHLAELGEEWVHQGVAPALALLVARRGLVVLHQAFGHLTSQADSSPTPPDALFTLASITKLFTATSLMVLVEDGRVGLNREVSGYIPEFQGEGKDKVLVRHLLTHTSGIIEAELEKSAKDGRGKIKVPPAGEALHPLLNEYLSLRYGCPLGKPPGEQMSYADFNFDLVAEIVRRVSGTPLDRFAHTRVFQPLGMKDSCYCRVDAPLDRRAQRAPVPSMVPDTWDQAWYAAYDVARDRDRLFTGSGGAFSTVMDMAIFAQMFLNGGSYGAARVLSPASVSAMTRNQTPGIPAKIFDEAFPDASWGLGWSVHGSKTGSVGGLYSPEAFEHWGNGGAYIWVDPANEIVGVYLSSAPLGDTPKIWADNWRSDIFTDAVTAAVVEP